MERYCATGQSPQRAVVPMEEEEEEEGEEEEEEEEEDEEEEEEAEEEDELINSCDHHYFKRHKALKCLLGLLMRERGRGRGDSGHSLSTFGMKTKCHY